MSHALGIIQTRGFGDILIALPIALAYHEQGYHVHWPVADIWVEQLAAQVPWVKWIPIPYDSGGLFFYETPAKYLKELGCTKVVCLYQALTNHPFTKECWFQHTSFDQYKYIRAGVAFKDKLRLRECVQRDSARELALYDKVVGESTSPYVVTHLAGSEQTVRFDPQIIPEGHAVVNISSEGRVFDWLTIIERADMIVMTDSSFANLVDGMDIPSVTRYFIPQHHILLSATLLGNWQYLPNPDLKPSARIN